MTVSRRLAQEVQLGPELILRQAEGRTAAGKLARPADGRPLLVVLAAGKGTRFGSEPKCIQPVGGVPLARHSIDAFRTLSEGPATVVVGHLATRVADALGDDNVYVLSHNAAGGTGQAAYEALAVQSVSGLDPLLVITMGDRIVPAEVFAMMLAKHRDSGDATLTMLTADYAPPAHQGKGRILRDANGEIHRIIEQRDIEAMPAGDRRDQWLACREGNCPLYVIRASRLLHYLSQVTNDNEQGQFYLTDIIELIREDGGTIRSVTISPDDAAYELICADVTRPRDLERLNRTHAAVVARIDDASGCEGARHG